MSSTMNLKRLKKLHNPTYAQILRARESARRKEARKQGQRLNRKFRLIGRTTVFRTTRYYLAAGFIPAFIGVSECGGWETGASYDDVEWLD